MFIKTNLKDKLLILKIKDTQPQSGVCNYYVTHTELDQKNSTLKVIVAKDFCPNERFGKSEGEIYWVVPKSLALQSAKICLSVNNQKLGLINLGENKNKFDVRDACQ
ncbi:MAG: hypothetical protein IPM57_07005 [Oligoflexia bacterium]|nr:hypothetical protein [Oligoflexia bacterium]